MRFSPTGIPGAWLIEPERHADERGWFARTWCRREFAAHGIPADFPQGNLSSNRRRGTLRGLHFQLPPSMEGKLVRCAVGEIYDVIVDLRCESPAWLRHYGVVLSRANGAGLYIPPGCAHGFQTLADDSEVAYAMTDYHDAASSAGVRWNDPAFGIRWPLPEPAVMSDRDRDYPDFAPAAFHAFKGYGLGQTV
jgi:dTDP-4-dehydrorhamnose 3,5-epimerase